VIGRHIRNVFAEGELVRESNVQNLHIAGSDIYQRFKPGGDMAADFQARFGALLEAEALNQNHQIVIVAAELDASSERIVGYLSERDIAINVLCFQVFQLGEQQLISRAWLLDPTEAPQATSASKPGMPAEPWNGEF